MSAIAIASACCATAFACPLLLLADLNEPDACTVQGVTAWNAAAHGECLLVQRPGAKVTAGRAGRGRTGDRTLSALPSHFNSRTLLLPPHIPTCVLVQFFPVSRSSFLKWLFGSDFSYLIKFHRWAAWDTQIIPTSLIVLEGTALRCLLPVSHTPLSGAPLSVLLISAMHCLLYMEYELFTGALLI